MKKEIRFVTQINWDKTRILVQKTGLWWQGNLCEEVK